MMDADVAVVSHGRFVRGRSRERVAYLSTIVVTFIVFLLTWEIVGRVTSPLFFAPISETLQEFVRAVNDPRGRLLRGFIETVSVLVPGYMLAAVLGSVIGVAMGRNSLIYQVLDPYVTVLYNTPRIALIPILMMWLGIGVPMKMTIVVLAAIFPVIVNTMIGVRDVSGQLAEPARSFGASEAKLLRSVILPASLPYIVTGLKLGLGRAITSVIVAEFFVSVSGLGGVLYSAASSYNMARMFVPVIILAVIGITIDALLGGLERLVRRWYGT